jgi:hypothetical protein
MPIIRSTGRDVLVRYAGRRMRVTTEWTDVVDEAMERLHKAAAEQGDEIETKSPAKSKASAPKPKKSKQTSKDSAAD